MFGEKAFELIKEIKRAPSGQVPAYNEDLIRQVFDEMKTLFEENQREVAATHGGEQGLFSGVQLRHASLERDKRCVLAYVYNRMMRLKELRWDIGSVLPVNVKLNLCENEVRWYTDYNRSLAKYMTSVGGVGIDLTQNVVPPRSLYIEVRCTTDYGEFETEDGTVVLLKKNSQHFLPTSQCEHLVRQGIVEHVLN